MAGGESPQPSPVRRATRELTTCPPFLVPELVPSCKAPIHPRGWRHPYHGEGSPLIRCDASLGRQIADGNEAAFDAFVRANWVQAVRACRLLLPDAQDAEEAAQDAFVSLHRHRATLRDPARLGAWFYRVLVNAARQRRRRLPPREEPLSGEEAAGVDESHAADLRASVRAALAELPLAERIAVVLCHFCDLPDAEAAAVAGWPLGTYKWRLARARRRLAPLLRAGPSSGRRGEGCRRA